MDLQEESEDDAIESELSTKPITAPSPEMRRVECSTPSSGQANPDSNAQSTALGGQIGNDMVIQGNKPARLRYALQKAIQFRVQGHVDPMVPLHKVKAEVIMMLASGKRSQSALRLWESTKMDTQDVGGPFIKYLRQHVQAERQSWQSQEKDTDVLF
ncbi:hypothetical protein LQW54_002595 [Pestalotiopsis sp. IQ-011]